jgi:type VI secretion system protein ImpL
MRKIFLNRWFLAFIGALLLCLLIYFVGPLVTIAGYAPLGNEIVQYVVMGAVVLLIIILMLIGSLRSRKKDDKLIEAAAGVPPPKDDKTQAIDAQRMTQRNKLTEALADMRKARGSAGGGYLYEFPWYVIIGPPGAGKTTALLNSGQRFPLAERHGAQEIKGEGGTRNCDWYFTEQAVIIDTAGRYTTQDSDQSIDQAGWRNFLGLLKETRPSQPLNGVLVVFDVAYLIGRTQDERRADARAVRTRLIELQETFGLRLPVYVAFTKLDRIAGFAEFFDDLSKEEREQVLGLTFPYQEKGAPPHKSFSDAFDRLLARLKGRLLDRLQAERDLPRRNLIFGFPAQFASLRPIVDEMLTEAADESRFATPLLVRGVYFTSATQQGLPIDRLMGVLSQKFGVSQMQMPAQVGAGRGFFLQRLFEGVIYREAGLVGANASVVRRRRLIRLVSFATIGVITLGLTGLWVWSYIENAALIARVNTRVADLAPQIAAASDPATNLGDGDTTRILDLLNAIRDLPTGYADQQAGRAGAVGFGLYQGRWLGGETSGLYRRALTNLFLPRLIMRAQRRLFDNLADADQTYRNLKTYLMLYQTDRLQRDHITAWFQSDWAALPEDSRVALMGHLQALLTDLWDPLPGKNEPLVAEARDRAQRLSPAQRAYAQLTTGGSTRPWRITENNQGVSNVITRISRRPITEAFNGLYTIRCYYNWIVPRVPLVAAAAGQESWVFNDAAPRAGSEQGLQNEVLGLYYQAYIQQWESILTDLAFTDVSELNNAVRLFLGVSGNPSPYGRLMREIALQVKLTQPPQQAAVASTTGGQTLQQITTAAQTGGQTDDCDSPATVPMLLGRGTFGLTIQAFTATSSAFTARIAGPDNPAGVVDRHFLWLTDFAGGDATQMQDFLRLIANSGQLANQKLNEGGGAADLAQLMGQLDTQARAQLPPVIAAMVTRLATQGRVVAIDTERANIVSTWAQNVLPFCTRTTLNRYPFVRASNAPNESGLDDFTRVFAPRTGLIDQFFQNNLTRHVDVTNPNQYRLRTPGLNIDQSTLDMFSRAARIRDAFFPLSGGGALTFIFDITTQVAGTTRQSVIEMENTTLTIEPPATPNATVQWNGRGGARLALDGDDSAGFNIQGAWAFLRMFDRMSPRRVADDTYDLTLPGGIRLRLRARAQINPFSTRQALGEFRCAAIQ